MSSHAPAETIAPAARPRSGLDSESIRTCGRVSAHSARPDLRHDPVLRVRGLRKAFAGHLSLGRREVLRGIDLEVRRGEIYGLLGPNGAGKTTTIKSILSLQRPDAGTITLFDLPARDPAARRKVGFLPENPCFYDDLTAREFLDFSARLAGVPREGRARAIPELLERVGLQDAPPLPLRKFSKGMVQRVGMAQALIGDPELVVLDEPMSGLDPIGRREFRDIILSLRQAGRTVFFSSHILQDAEMICDRVGILKAGRLAREGALVDLLDPGVPAFEVTLAEIDPPASPDVMILSRRGGETLVRVEGAETLERLLKLALAAGGAVRSVTPLRRTLEEIFLEEVRGTAGGSDAPPPPVPILRGGSRS